MLCTYSIRPYFTFAAAKLPVKPVFSPQKSKSYQGFSLLECVIALFILAILLSVVLKHQDYLLDKQAEIEASALEERTARNHEQQPA